MIKRYEFEFAGKVQGVGFRYTARNNALKRGLTGWVRNEFDGSVIMQVQGETAAVSALIADLENDRYIRIESINSSLMKEISDEKNFEIKY